MSESTEGFIKWIVLTALIIIVWNVTMANIISFYFLAPSSGAAANPNSPGIEEEIKNSGKIEIFADVVINAPIIEESVFRLIPIMLAACFILIFNLSRAARFLAMLTTITAVSILFGYLHNGWISVVFQGFAGFVYSLLFLKFWGWKPWEDDESSDEFLLEGSVITAFLVVVIAHALQNLISVIAILYS